MSEEKKAGRRAGASPDHTDECRDREEQMEGEERGGKAKWIGKERKNNRIGAGYGEREEEGREEEAEGERQTKWGWRGRD